MTIQDKIEGKRILLFSLSTFGYENIIADKLKFFGAQVDFYDERPSNNIFTKGIIRLKRSLYQYQIKKYYQFILKEISTIHYDFLFVITGEVIPEFFLEEFKLRNPNCTCIYYTWDSFANCPHPISILKYFDKQFTFDSNDALKYDLYFRPLFYCDQYGLLNNEKSFRYKLLFIGTAHSDRYKVSNEIINWCKSQNISYFAYYFIQSRLVYLYKRLFDPVFKSVNYFDLNFKSLELGNVLSLFSLSEVILDINHPHQSGLTMRSFEALGAGKKLITTNNAIKNYPFYNQNNILIIDRNNPVVDRKFFDLPFVSMDEKLVFSMSISGWIHEIFLEEYQNSSWNNVL